MVLLSSQASAVWPPWMKQDEPDPVYPDITASVDHVRSKQGAHDVILIDARPAAEYALGHIPGAISLPPPDELLPGNLPAALGAAGLSGRSRYICYGQRTWSDPAAYILWMLETGGAQCVQLMEGGYEAWLAAGGHADVEPRRLTATVWTAAPGGEHLASLDYIREHYGVDGHEIIDARSRVDWEGIVADTRQAPPARVGHIPHSLQFDFREFTEHGALLPADECRDIFSVTGPRPSNPVRLGDEFIVHGEGGESGAMGYYLLRRAGVAAVRYYPGGWRRWRADETLPVVRFVSGEELRDLVDRENRWPWQDQVTASPVLIDVRHETDYARGHIPGSVCLTSRLFADSLDVYLARYWPTVDRATTPIITYCYGPTCIRSRYTSTAAARAGFVDVWRFYGGLEIWREVGGRIAQ